MMKTPEITEEQGGAQHPGGAASLGSGSPTHQDTAQSVQTRVKERFLGQHPDYTPSKAAPSAAHNVETPTGRSERRSVDARRITEGGGEGGGGGATPRGDLGAWSYTTHLHGPLHAGADAGGPRTIDAKYLPFAAGFAHMAAEAPVYRSTRLHGINPTAAVSEDISYYYTLDSGRVPPAAVAANPETAAEFVRNTPRGTHGGLFRSLMKPIE